MCACRQKKSFLIEDILSDTKKRPYRNLSYVPTKPLYCSGNGTSNKETNANLEAQDGKLAKLPQFEHEMVAKLPDSRNKQTKTVEVQHDRTVKPTEVHHDNTKLQEHHEKLLKFNVTTDVHNEMELSQGHLECRRNTYPLYPTAMKPNFPWSYREPRFSYYSDPVLNSNLMRSQLVTNRYVSHPLPIRQPYGFDRGTVGTNCCSGWWGLGGRRKGGQVRFTGAQTAALERRFAASKYLSPDERRALANSLRLSDRQVKTWFQNRRAKWRRTTPESADPGSPASDDGSDDDLLVDDE